MDQDPRFQDNSPIESAPSLVPCIVMGAGAAIAGGIAWAVISGLTGYEIGFAAVGLGALVGLAMSRTTDRRDKTVALIAALLAFGGLVTARVAIAEYVVPGSTLEEVLDDPEIMSEAAALELMLNGGFSSDVQARLEAVPEEAIIPDDLYTEMLVEGRAHLATLAEEDRERIAGQYTGFVLGGVNTGNLVAAQLSLYDLLWVFLAVSTAWKMMAAGPVGPGVDPDAPPSIAA